jgi:hypothetical protein
MALVRVVATCLAVAMGGGVAGGSGALGGGRGGRSVAAYEARFVGLEAFEPRWPGRCSGAWWDERESGDSSRDVAMAVGIVSAPWRARNRAAIRATWLRLDHAWSGATVHRFFVGLNASTGAVDAAVAEEAEKFGDVTVLPVSESYRNISYKAVAIFKWGLEACGARYVVRANDDVYMRLAPVVELLVNEQPVGVYAGHFLNLDGIEGGGRADVVRAGHASLESCHARGLEGDPVCEAQTKKGLTFVQSVGAWPSDNYGAFAQGNGVLLSADLAERVAALSRKPHERLWMDDVQIGHLVYEHARVRLQVKADLAFYGDGIVQSKCTEAVTHHFDVTPEQMRIMYKNELKGRPRCEGLSSGHTLLLNSPAQSTLAEYAVEHRLVELIREKETRRVLIPYSLPVPEHARAVVVVPVPLVLPGAGTVAAGDESLRNRVCAEVRARFCMDVGDQACAQLCGHVWALHTRAAELYNQFLAGLVLRARTSLGAVETWPVRLGQCQGGECESSVVPVPVRRRTHVGAACSTTACRRGAVLDDAVVMGFAVDHGRDTGADAHAPSPVNLTSELLLQWLLLPAESNSTTSSAPPSPSSPRALDRVRATCNSAVNLVSGTREDTLSDLQPREHAQVGRLVVMMPFNNEFDVLEAHLHELVDVADVFIVAEASKTHQGDPKPLHLVDRLRSGSDPNALSRFVHKLRVVVVDDMPQGCGDKGTETGAWACEHHQRNALARGLGMGRGADLDILIDNDRDVVVVVDADEIVTTEAAWALKFCQVPLPAALDLRMFYYSLHWKKKGNWVYKAHAVTGAQLAALLRGDRGGVVQDLGNGPVQAVRDGVHRDSTGPDHTPMAVSVVLDAGAHCSYFMSVSEVVDKLHAFAHTEFQRKTFEFSYPNGTRDLRPWDDRSRIAEAIAAGRLLYVRDGDPGQSLVRIALAEAVEAGPHLAHLQLQHLLKAKANAEAEAEADGSSEDFHFPVSRRFFAHDSKSAALMDGVWAARDKVRTAYVEKTTTASDINEHLATLRHYAAASNSVFETGVRGVTSSWAFLLGLLDGMAREKSICSAPKKRLLMNDVVNCDEDTQGLRRAVAEINAAFVAACGAEAVELRHAWTNNLKLDLTMLAGPAAKDGMVDVTFVDTWHVYGQLRRELFKFSAATAAYLVLHDTTVDAFKGETLRQISGRNGAELVALYKGGTVEDWLPYMRDSWGGRAGAIRLERESGIPFDQIVRGLEPALHEFLAASPEWRVKEVFENNNGLTVLERIKDECATHNPWYAGDGGAQLNGVHPLLVVALGGSGAAPPLRGRSETKVEADEQYLTNWPYY